MKSIYHLFLYLLIGSLTPLSLWGQLQGGIKIGIELENNFNLGETINVHNKFALMQIKPTFEGDIGFWLGFSNNVLLRSEVLLETTEERYILGQLGKNGNTQIVSDRRYFLTLPILIGKEFEFLNGYIGIAPQIPLNQPKRLNNWFDQHRSQASLNLKYIIGFELKINSITLGFRYDNSLIYHKDKIILNGISGHEINYIERFTVISSFNFFH